jgi:putative ABC transport system permease protein
MLELKNVHKYYTTPGQTVKALKGINVSFRKNEFVSVLGPSGCGKTTLLNLIGGLDKYTSGDLIIRGKSTRNFKDKDWDSYRNHSIGFVFQNYNLIPHLTVLENVELALTLSGVSISERKKRAAQVLEKVGLGDKLKSKPNQLSGGQMQRVAIARALINNPDILLADEPTGALDSKTSEQVMDILKEISQERLIIMVTHNSEIAEKYSSRIIRLLDGEITDDTNPYQTEQAQPPQADAAKPKKEKRLKTSMSFFTALTLSFKNLLTKKARTFLVSFAGSIGIIGIALIFALSSGFQGYVNKVQNDTLSSYPLIIERESVDLDGLLSAIRDRQKGEDFEKEEGKIYSNDVMIKMFKTMMSRIRTNNLKNFKKYVEENRDELGEYLSAIKYGYDVDLRIYLLNQNGNPVQINPTTIFQNILPQKLMMPFMNLDFEVWSEMIDNEELLKSQYDLVAGKWPEDFDEVVLIVDKNNQIDDYVLYALGIKDQEELEELMRKIQNNEEYEYNRTELSYDQVLSMRYKLIFPTDYYQKTEEGIYEDKSGDMSYLKGKVENGTEIKISGIIRPNEDAAATSIIGSVGYTSALTEHYLSLIADTDIVKEQMQNPETDIFTGRTFFELQIEEIDAYIDASTKLTEAQKATAKAMPAEQKHQAFQEVMDFKNTYQNNLKKLGLVDFDDPDTIRFYATDFKSKEQLKQFIIDYNAMQENEEDIISYTDYVDIVMSSVSVIITAITYVLIGFVSISLVVSSIMIGIITYISVLERIKEIGLLRSIGASKKDISRVFNAETIIIGFGAGILGIIITLLLTIPTNILLVKLAGIPPIAALPVVPAVILIVLSMALTLISGFIPSKIAANKDPVIALRTE